MHCTAPVATLALVENAGGYSIPSSVPGSPVPLLRLLAQQSGCFRVVDRGAGLHQTVQEQQLKDEGILRKESTVHKGRGYEAQYALTPSLAFSENNAGRSLGGVAAALPGVNKVPGLVGLAEGVKLKEAQVTLLLTDNETTEQVAAATGSARATDLGVGGFMLGGLSGAAAGWSNTNEGKVIAAAFLDAFDKLVPQVQQLQNKELPPPVQTKQ